MEKTKRVGNRLSKRVQTYPITNLRAQKGAIQKSTLDVSLSSGSSPMKSKRTGKHKRNSPPSPEPVPSPPSQHIPSPPSQPVPSPPSQPVPLPPTQPLPSLSPFPSPPTIPSSHFSQPMPSPPQSPSLADAQLGEDNICNNSVDTTRLNRKKRGVTRLKGLGIQDTPTVIEVDFNEKGQPVGDSSITLASFIGALVRNKVPVIFDDWRRVPKSHKDNLWTLVLLRYKLDETHKDYIFQKMANSLREYRCHVGNATVKAMEFEEEEKLETLAKLKPENLTENEWSDFIKKRTSVKFQAKSFLMKKVRERHTHPHTMSRLGYARLEQKLKQENPDEEINRALLWTKGHVNKNGNPINKAVEESIKKIQQFSESQPKIARHSLKDDAISHVLGADRSGRVTGLGFGVTSTKLKAQAHTSKVVLSLEEKIKAIEAKLSLISGSDQQGGDGCSSEVDAGRITMKSNHASNIGLPNPLAGAKCKLMSWYEKGEVVAEGEIFSTNPADLVHFKPLGLDACRVFVEFAVNAEAFLWRTTDEFKIIGDAIGSTVAWSKDYISFDLS